MKNNSSSLAWKVISLLTIPLILTTAEACPNGIAASTVYYVPHVRDICGSNTICPKFQSEVKLQGSGTLSNGKILKYTGKTIDIGNCDTARGAAGTCLIPYMSVAADPRHFRMGDVIEMPSLKGTTIKMPDGKTISHPGYFIVMDTGGAIKGPNRFDFFTGPLRAESPKNEFGYKSKLSHKMYNKNTCSNNKAFKVHRRNSPGHQKAIAAINNAYGSNNVEVPGSTKGAR